ncbi:hypothetical protein B0H13DRAFT_2329957 [Mycena leptocephala]|nr:hypothetical protein B0H13DRAFT_2329957 [Mycena leptocephala]
MSSGTRLQESTQHVVLAASIPGVTLSVLFLTVVAYLQWNPVSRPHLNRISFRLLVYALIANVVFGSQMLVLVWMKEPSPGCSIVAFLCMAAPFFSACIFFCVALNLQLVLVYGVNGNKMEKYYIFGAAFVSGACIIPIWAAGKLGWYAPTRQCWIKDPTPKGQLDWLIATQYAPMLLMSAVEVLSFINILTFMLRQVSKIQRLRADTSESRSVIATLASSTPPKHPIVKFRPIIIRIDYDSADIEYVLTSPRTVSPATQCLIITALQIHAFIPSALFLVKQYPGIETILGMYSAEYDHPLGNANLRFTQIPQETREYIAGLLRLKVSLNIMWVLHLIHRGVYDNDDVFERDLDENFVAARSEFIQLKDIRHIEKEIEAESVRLTPDDDLSTIWWVDNLRIKGHLLGVKSKTDPPPPSSETFSR